MNESVLNVELKNEVVACRLKRERLYGSIYLKINARREIKVSAPRLVSLKRIHEFLESKKSWMEENLKRIDDRVVVKKIVEGEKFFILGEEFELKFVEGGRAPRARLNFLDKKILLYFDIEKIAENKSSISKALEKEFKRVAKDFFHSKTELINDQYYQLKYGNVKIKEQSTRYGSCSSKGNLNFNWKLIFAPEPVADYVIAHELSHLKEMNHSAKFWNLVAVASPDFLAHKKWLKNNGHKLSFRIN